MKLSDGEKLTLLRRRKGTSQSFEAKTFGVTQAMYSLWESDKHPFREAQIARVVPTKYEECFILRRRAGLTQVSAAQALGVPVTEIIAVERGSGASRRLSPAAYRRFLVNPR